VALNLALPLGMVMNPSGQVIEFLEDAGGTRFDTKENATLCPT
jgi:hypothetical protein